MSVIVKPAQPRRVNSALSRRNKFYVYDDDGEESSNDSVKTKCATNSTQTKNEQRLCSSHTIQKCNVLITPRKKLKRKKAKLMDWKKYHRLSVIYSFIEELEKDFPAICTVSSIGKSVEGRDIKMLKISNSNAGNSGVWLDACIHSREWITTAVVTYMASVIVRNFHNLSDAVTNKDWHIIPVLNPDGYEYTHTHERMWRKNRAKYGGEHVGVDLNRNFSYAWGQGDEGSSDDPKHVFYRGPAPFSEPETVAVRKPRSIISSDPQSQIEEEGAERRNIILWSFEPHSTTALEVASVTAYRDTQSRLQLLEQRGNEDTILGSVAPFRVFLSFHSYYELIIFPWGNRTDPCPDYVRLLEAGSLMARAIFDTTGKIYKVGSTKDLTYYACGTSIDWSYSIAKIPYSFMVELRSRKNKFRLPKDQILETCSEAWNAVLKLMDYVDTH